MGSIKTIKTGSQYNIYGKIYEVVSTEDTRITMRSVQYKTILFFTPDLLNSLLLKGEVRLHAIATIDSSYEAVLHTMPQAQKKEYLRKIYYSRELTERFQGSLPHDAVEAEVERLSKCYGDDKAPCYTSVYSWIRTYRESNFNPFSLIKRKSTLPRGKQLNNETRDIISTFIYKFYLQPKHPTIKTLYKLITAHIDNENEDRSSYSLIKISTPSLSTVSREINRINQYYRDVEQFGKQEAQRVNNYSTKQKISRLLLRLVEGDSHEMDIIVVDEKRRVLGRPWLHLLIETSTRYVIGYELSLTPPCAEKFLKSLRMALSCEDPEHFGGRPMEITVDNGAEAANETVKNAGDLLCIKIHYAPPLTPNAKAIVERFFGTLISQLIQAMEGSTGSNPIIGKHYKAEDGACIQMSKLNELFDYYIKEVYHQEYHQSIHTSPHQAWLTETLDQLPPECYTQDALKGICQQVVFKRLNGGRVTHKHLSWTGPSLPAIEAALGKSRKAIVYIDITDLSHVWVCHPDKPTELVDAFATAPYQKKLTMYAHQLVLDDLKKNKIKFDESRARQALLKIYNELWEIKHNSTAQSRHNLRKNRKLLVAAEKLGLSSRTSRPTGKYDAPTPAKLPTDFASLPLQNLPTYVIGS
ncbi:integrase family protein [Pseudomonas sp. GM21]|uniref:integrase catalytic domain-containing protein n=1 Tax=Pseudomonas sp. GM21 TaxID=1144325 RepID=UPI00027229A1|nr:DDE-type integrase/transposase/recombinase [Pseudomonas sp. GM21]EJM12872.1 integrase family protein [Pseudomonas sp. GM21]